MTNLSVNIFKAILHDWDYSPETMILSKWAKSDPTHIDKMLIILGRNGTTALTLENARLLQAASEAETQTKAIELLDKVQRNEDVSYKHIANQHYNLD